MNTRKASLSLSVIGLLLLLIALPTYGQPAPPLEFCRNGAFSTEEDFMMRGEESLDGTYVSDGDLLSPTGQICARNRDLLEEGFDVEVDLGLDAVHILNFDDQMVAFSTELDSPFGTFTAGDLLMTNGTVIPNAALMLPFQIRHDVGLDAVQFVATPEQIKEFVALVSGMSPDDLANGVLQQILREFGMDIWFSIEGSLSFGEQLPVILDGDLLSAQGFVVARQQDLLTMPPAGIPDEGVDFGLDAVALRELLEEDAPAIEQIFFSTEILYEGELSFTDGDVLWDGGNIVTKHEDLIQAFKPEANFLGLDGLWTPLRGRGEVVPLVKYMCSDDGARSVVDFDGGVVVPADNAPYTGLFTHPGLPSVVPPEGQIQDQPCGAQVPIDGDMPETAGITRFRLAYRPDGTPRPTPGDVMTDAIQTTWKVPRKIDILGFTFCSTVVPSDPSTYYELATDGNGWMDATEWHQIDNGTHPIACQKDLLLGVWNSATASDPNGLYVLWLEWEDGGTFQEEVVEHHLQLDNRTPQVSTNANGAGVEIRLTDGVTVVPPCGEETTSQSRFQVWAQFEDVHYGSFQVRVKGGIAPRTVTYPVSRYNATNDNTAPPTVSPALATPPSTPPFTTIKNTNDTGTNPVGGFRHIRDIDLLDFGESFRQCCYLVELRVVDRTIRHGFNGVASNETIPHTTPWFPTTFAAGPGA